MKQHHGKKSAQKVGHAIGQTPHSLHQINAMKKEVEDEETTNITDLKTERPNATCEPYLVPDSNKP